MYFLFRPIHRYYISEPINKGFTVTHKNTSKIWISKSIYNNQLQKHLLVRYGVFTSIQSYSYSRPFNALPPTIFLILFPPPDCRLLVHSLYFSDEKEVLKGAAAQVNISVIGSGHIGLTLICVTVDSHMWQLTCCHLSDTKIIVSASRETECCSTVREVSQFICVFILRWMDINMYIWSTNISRDWVKSRTWS